MLNHHNTASTTAKPLNITVENIRELNGTGNLRAFVSVTVNDKLTIHSCRIIQQPGQAAWVSLPQREWTNQQGQKRFSPIIELPDEVKSAIQVEVLRAWEDSQ